MLAIDAVLAGVLIYFKLRRHEPAIEYMHLLVTYRFGFMKRALIGTIVSVFSDRVPIYFVYAIGLAAWLLTGILYMVVFFRSQFGRHKDRALLFAFIAGSPFFFKNFLFTVGYFDIYGCAFAMLALLLPANALYPLIIAAGCAVLLLIHHLHLFIYVPTIALIFTIRYYLMSPDKPRRMLAGAVIAAALAALFMLLLAANAPVPVEALLSYMRARALDPFAPQQIMIWYSSVGNEMMRTWSALPAYALRIPVYAALIALHIPLIRLYRHIISGLASQPDTVCLLIGLAVITAAYPMMWLIVHDHSRHLSNWAVCMLLSMHAAMMLPSRREIGQVRFDTPANRRFAWAVTCIPRVGVTIPF